MSELREHVAWVCGASRGVGRGVATALAEAGATVFATGRSISATTFPPGVQAIACDHRDDEAVEQVLQRLRSEHGHVDILANCVWGGYERMVENGRFTWALPFWEQPRWRWEAMFGAGVRAAFVASQLAASVMVPAGRGLIVHISHWAAQKYLGSVLYGMSKAATDKMTADMARELEKHGVTVVSLYPGLVRTEAVLAAGVFDLSNSESPEYCGRAIAALATDPDVKRWNGKTVTAAALGQEYGFSDIDGRTPRPLTLADI